MSSGKRRSVYGDGMRLSYQIKIIINEEKLRTRLSCFYFCNHDNWINMERDKN